MTALAAGSLINAPLVLTASRIKKKSEQGELIFKPHDVQSGIGPHLLDWAYASDVNWDAFHSNITASSEGVKLSDTEGIQKFAVDVRWNVEGFGYIYITADNGGNYYELPAAGKTRELNLNFELAKSRVLRNTRRLKILKTSGWQPSKEVSALLELSSEYYADAHKVQNDPAKCGRYAQTALFYAMTVSEKMELEQAEFTIQKQGYRPDFYIGCDARGYFQMDPDIFLERFTNWAYSSLVKDWEGATTMLSPVCTPIGSTFSIEVIIITLSTQSLITSYSISFHPNTDCSTSTWATGLISRPLDKNSSNSSLLYAVEPPLPPKQ